MNDLDLLAGTDKRYHNGHGRTAGGGFGIRPDGNGSGVGDLYAFDDGNGIGNGDGFRRDGDGFGGGCGYGLGNGVGSGRLGGTIVGNGGSRR
jgi:hypothetical protein